MAIDLIVPNVGESITEVQISAWLKAPGDYIRQDEPIVELESDKATVELPAPASGKLKETLKKIGEKASIGEVIGTMEEAEIPAETRAPQKEKTKSQPPAAKPLPASPQPKKTGGDGETLQVMPAARRALAERGLEPAAVTPSGPGGRLLKEDVLRHTETPQTPAPKMPPPPTAEGLREEEAVPMTPMRKRIAQHLVFAQQNAALLTTFNEVDMTEVNTLRKAYRDEYEKKYGIRLGIMSFFVKATVDALKQFPQINAEIRGEDIIYKNYYDIGIAVGGGKGLVVPILRNAERMSFAAIELAIADFSQRAQQNKITIEELQGGTFTISNGGIYGSLMSTPIINPPQSGILGMHAIQDRPVARDGHVVIRPMMYIALTYDHRIVDGREAVTFLKRVKQCIEDPTRIFLEV